MRSYSELLKKQILNTVHHNLLAYTPSLQMQVVYRGELIADITLGRKYKYYDYASLTKIVFAVPALMQAVDLHKIKINDPISKYLSWWPHKKITLKQVLSHSAGLPWWAPFYSELDLTKVPKVRREQLKNILSKSEILKSKKSTYSDVDFILLGFLLEKLYKKPLAQIWKNLNYAKKLKTVHFNELSSGTKSQVNSVLGDKFSAHRFHLKYPKAQYAPTEKCPWRKKTLQGEVHDENTWSFGGVSSHAGLFGTMDDLTHYGLLLRAGILNKTAIKEKSTTIAKSSTVQLFTKRAIPAAKGDWALGFMLPTKGQASCGKHFHPTSIGHTGFSGTSLWFDPQRDLLVTILSNRVHPTYSIA
ncbi:MAG: serine hydrolase [Bdellovibrionales bacterium]